MLSRLLIFGIVFYLFSKTFGLIFRLFIRAPKEPTVKGKAENSPLDIKEQDVQDVDFEDIKD